MTNKYYMRKRWIACESIAQVLNNFMHNKRVGIHGHGYNREVRVGTKPRTKSINIERAIPCCICSLHIGISYTIDGRKVPVNMPIRGSRDQQLDGMTGA